MPVSVRLRISACNKSCGTSVRVAGTCFARGARGVYFSSPAFVCRVSTPELPKS